MYSLSENKLQYQLLLMTLVGSVLYTYLFYLQSIGINYLIFSCFLVACLIFYKKSSLKDPSFLALSFGVLLTGFYCFYYGTYGYVVLNKISCLLLAASSIAIDSSLPTHLIQGLYTIISSPFYIIYKVVSRRTYGSNVSRLLKYILLSILPLGIAAIFVWIYSQSNVLFADLLKQFRIEFISLSTVAFFFYALWICYILFQQRKINRLETWDISRGDQLLFDKEVLNNSGRQIFSLSSEIYIASAAFILLNIILLINNGVDIYYLVFKNTMPKNITYSEYIHNGVNALIFSIVLAIIIIMYFFQLRLNFIDKSNRIKLLAYIWIIQNMILLSLCVYKNQAYIEVYSYTYKRVGVYFFLALCCVGLILTFVKLYKNKTNFFLFRKQSWALYVLSILFFGFDWDSYITSENISQKNSHQVDKAYLLDLGHTNYKLLYDKLICDSQFFNTLSKDKDKYSYTDKSDFISGEYLYDFSHPEYVLVDKVERLKKQIDSADFPSYCYSKRKIISEIYHLN